MTPQYFTSQQVVFKILKTYLENNVNFTPNNKVNFINAGQRFIAPNDTKLLTVKITNFNSNIISEEQSLGDTETEPNQVNEIITQTLYETFTLSLISQLSKDGNTLAFIYKNDVIPVLNSTTGRRIQKEYNCSLHTKRVSANDLSSIEFDKTLPLARYDFNLGFFRTHTIELNAEYWHNIQLKNSIISDK